MSRVAVRFVALFALAFLPGCNRTLHLELPSDTPVRLVTDLPIRSDGVTPDKEVLLQPEAPEYKRLQEWVAHNQNGWSQSFAASPGGGIRVHSGNLHLHFVDGAVFTWTDKGAFQKEIREEDYAFLKKLAGI